MRKSITCILVVVMILQMFSVFIAPVSSEKNDNGFVPDEIIVKFKKEVPNDIVDSVISSNGLSLISKSLYSEFILFL